MTAKPQGMYWHCQQCEFLFRHPPEAQVPAAKEKFRYEQHQNNESEGYRHFFEELRLKIKSLVPQGTRILDYGCGPTKYLAALLEKEDGYPAEVYDPFFYAETLLHKNSFDVIVSTEVLEHFYNPKESFKHLTSLLKPGGFIFVLTSERPQEKTDFNSWHYRKDYTHVSFFNQKSLKSLADQFEVSLLSQERNLWVLKKNS